MSVIPEAELDVLKLPLACEKLFGSIAGVGE